MKLEEQAWRLAICAMVLVIGCFVLFALKRGCEARGGTYIWLAAECVEPERRK